ncbi:MAG: sugar transferase [Pseudomonadota bacterium]
MDEYTAPSGPSFGASKDSSRWYARRGKRALDIFISLILVPVIAPAILILYLVVRADGGPGVFAHARIGRQGRVFACFKLRTMVPDAERALADVLASDPAAAREWAETQKLRVDPRVTRVGAFLRRTSLDELPQIWNVLRGDMSLVGPRPVTAPELKRYGPYRSVYLSLTPGITGLWQVSGRNDVSYDERRLLDARYAQTVTLVRDLWLIFKTAQVLVRPTGR